jgi:hypothetical protein
MFHELVSHNDDIRRLLEKGYAVSFNSNMLLIRDIPYLDGEKKLRIGALLSKLKFIDQYRVQQEDHQVYFAGSPPHEVTGQAIANLGGGPVSIPLDASCSDVVIERSFSNKPIAGNGYADLFEKIESYVRIISGPAILLFGANPFTFRVVESPEEDSVFKFRDTLTSRAEISDLSRLLADDVVAVIGLGGSGAYELDYLVKSPVKEVRAFDHDSYYVHNAFRSPGRLDPLELGRSKVEVLLTRYENFRHGLVPFEKFVDETCSADFDGVTFAFVSVDKGSARKAIFQLLSKLKIPFIDVGMGIHRTGVPLSGMLRVTYYPADRATEFIEQGYADLSDAEDDIYRSNIQIAELNAMNAALAITRFKQIRGFYLEGQAHTNLLLDITDFQTGGVGSE